MSCRKLKKAGCGEYGDAKSNSYMLIDSAVAASQTKAATGGCSSRSCKSKGGDDSITNAVKNLTSILNNATAQSDATLTGGARRGRRVKAGDGLSSLLEGTSLAKLNDAIGAFTAANATSAAPATAPATGGCAGNCRGGQKKGGNAVDLAPFAVALSLIGVRMLKDKQFMNRVDSVINSPSSKKSSRSSRSNV